MHSIAWKLTPSQMDASWIIILGLEGNGFRDGFKSPWHGLFCDGDVSTRSTDGKDFCYQLKVHAQLL